LPTHVAGFSGNHRGNAFLRDVQFGTAEDLLQGDRRDHFTGKTRVVELVRVAEKFVWLEFEIPSAERMARSGAEIGERHFVNATDLRVHLVNFGGEAIRRKPFDHGVWIEERTVNPLGLGAEHSVKSNGIGVGCCHNRVVLLSFIITTNDADVSGHLSERILCQSVAAKDLKQAMLTASGDSRLDSIHCDSKVAGIPLDGFKTGRRLSSHEMFLVAALLLPGCVLLDRLSCRNRIACAL